MLRSSKDCSSNVLRIGTRERSHTSGIVDNAGRRATGKKLCAYQIMFTIFIFLN